MAFLPFAFISALLLQLVSLGFGFYNPIVPKGQDPSVKFYNGAYYLTQSVNDAFIVVMKSTRLENLGSPEINVTVWNAAPPLCCEVWAPELFFDDQTQLWFIYFAADDGNNDNHHSYVLQSSSQDPLGPYTFVGPMLVSNEWAIDSTAMVLDGHYYYLWSGHGDGTGGQQNIYIAEMSGPTNVTSDRYVISEPTNSWEMSEFGYGINEGPEALQVDGSTWIVYSASAAGTDAYCLGMLSYVGTDPLQMDSWVKSDGCVFAQDPSKSVYGPGHNSFTWSPDGTEVWNVYHAQVASESGFQNRSIRAQSVPFSSDGQPLFGTPVGFDEWVNPPSGEQ